MARLVKRIEQHPAEVKPAAESKWVCMCGLSGKRPFCDGSHKKTKDEKEGATYVYDEEKRVEVK